MGEHLDALSPQPASPAQEPAAAADGEQGSGVSDMETDNSGQAQPGETASEAPAAATQLPGPHAQRYQRLRGILTGSTPIQLYLEFLYTHNHADLQILRNMKGAVEARNSVCHSAVIFANATMHSGTTVDAFLRENLDWLSRATNWAKFNATAGLGVIHRYWMTTTVQDVFSATPQHPCPCLISDHVTAALQRYTTHVLSQYLRANLSPF